MHVLCVEIYRDLDISSILRCGRAAMGAGAAYLYTSETTSVKQEAGSQGAMVHLISVEKLLLAPEKHIENTSVASGITSVLIHFRRKCIRTKA